MPTKETTGINRSAWQRLKKNKGAMFGFLIICLSVILAIICYFIATDNSPNANRMVVEIGGRKPGHSQLFLKIPIRAEVSRDVLSQLIEGAPDAYQYLPIAGFREQGDSLFVEKYIDEGLTATQAYSISQLNSSFPPNKFKIERIRYWLGTDKYGRDILSRLLIGVRVSLAVGLVTVVISLSIGVLLGALAGYFKGQGR